MVSTGFLYKINLDIVSSVIVFNNNIFDNTEANFQSNGAINATYNWWGSTSKLGIQGTVSDKVMFDPILGKPNPRAPLILDTNPTPLPSPDPTPTPSALPTPTLYQES